MHEIEKTLRKNYRAERNMVLCVMIFLPALGVTFPLLSEPKGAFESWAIFGFSIVVSALLSLRILWLKKELSEGIASTAKNLSKTDSQLAAEMNEGWPRELDLPAPRAVITTLPFEVKMMQAMMWAVLPVMIIPAYVIYKNNEGSPLGILLVLLMFLAVLRGIIIMRRRNRTEIARQVELLRNGEAVVGHALQRVKGQKTTRIEIKFSYKNVNYTLLSGRLLRPAYFKMGMNVPVILDPNNPNNFVVYHPKFYGDCLFLIENS